MRQAAVGNPYYALDPAVLGGLGWLVLTDATGARLTENRPRPDGTVHIVPELAARLPETPDRGRTWTFAVKKGFRFSPPSGAPVTAQVVRSSLERALSPKLVNSYCRDAILSDIAGEKALRPPVTPSTSAASRWTATGSIDQAGGAVVDAAVPGRDAVLLGRPAEHAHRPRRDRRPDPVCRPVLHRRQPPGLPAGPQEEPELRRNAPADRRRHHRQGEPQPGAGRATGREREGRLRLRRRRPAVAGVRAGRHARPRLRQRRRSALCAQAGQRDALPHVQHDPRPDDRRPPAACRGARARPAGDRQASSTAIRAASSCRPASPGTRRSTSPARKWRRRGRSFATGPCPSRCSRPRETRATSA